MRFGIILPGGTATQQLELAELADRTGWDGVFVWEAAYGVDAWTLLGAMAQRTERMVCCSDHLARRDTDYANPTDAFC